MNGDNNKNRVSRLLRETFRDKVFLYTVLIIGISIFVYLRTTSATNTILKIINIVSIGLIPACLIGMLWNLLTQNKFFECVKSELADLLNNATINFKQEVCEKCRLDDPLNRFRIDNIYDDRSGLILKDLFESAKHKIWILITHYKSLTELTGVLKKLIQKSSEEVEIKILGLDPNSTSAELRCKESKWHKDLVADIKNSGWQVIEAFVKEAKKNEIKYVEWKLYDKYPNCCLFLVDSKIYYSPLVFDKRGQESIHFLVHEKNDKGETSKLFNQYKEHFEALFKVAKDTVLNIEDGVEITSNSKIF